MQKAAVKVILGKEYHNYEKALCELKLESLNDRREALALKFAKKSLENFNFSKLFPLREVKHEMKFRKSNKYAVKSSNTKRHKESAVPYLQNLLNKDHFEKSQRIKRLFEECQSSTKRPKIETRKWVNYISHVDVIT